MNANVLKLLFLGYSALFLTALFFQYGMGLEPCVKCIYQRLAVISLSLLFFAGSILNSTYRRLLYVAQGMVLYKGYLIAAEHAFKQHNFSLTSSCGFKPEFPTWLQLDQWLPFAFEARGMCDTIHWVFLGQTMPQWLSYIFIATSAILIGLIINEINIKKLINIHSNKS